MPETNGQQDNESRLDRIERAMEHFIDEHEMFRTEHRMLLRSQVLLQQSLEKLKDNVGEIGEKLNGLIGLVDSDHRVFHDRLNRLENRQ